ncbi:MAG: hypothetical protein Q7S06_03390 [Nanoarchaeota archaeon]|nr:hypothetical protein [Nanoarchaeota archaeon]
MPEKDTIFSSKIKSTGVFSFEDFYRFCYDWLSDEANLIVGEDSYKEKLSGDSKTVEIEWTCFRKITDYFRFDVKVVFRITNMTNVEIQKNGEKVKMNKGAVETSVKGILVRDYQGKFEKTGTQKFMRGIYEKWVIPSRIDQYEDKLVGDCDEFLNQAKAYLDLEGKR